MSPFFAMLCFLRYFLEFYSRSRKACGHGDDTLLDFGGNFGCKDYAAGLAGDPDHVAVDDALGVCIFLVDRDNRVGPFADNGCAVHGERAHGPLCGDHERELCTGCLAGLVFHCGKGCLAVLCAELVSVQDCSAEDAACCGPLDGFGLLELRIIDACVCRHRLCDLVEDGLCILEREVLVVSHCLCNITGDLPVCL